MIYKFGEVTVEIDCDETKLFYSKRNGISPFSDEETNYFLAINEPDNTDLEILRKLGIDPAKVGRVSFLGKANTSCVLYEITVLAVGKPVSDLKRNEVYIPAKIGEMSACIRSNTHEFYNHDLPLPKPALELTYVQKLRWLME